MDIRERFCRDSLSVTRDSTLLVSPLSLGTCRPPTDLVSTSWLDLSDRILRADGLRQKKRLSENLGGLGLRPLSSDIFEALEDVAD